MRCMSVSGRPSYHIERLPESDSRRAAGSQAIKPLISLHPSLSPYLLISLSPYLLIVYRPYAIKRFTVVGAILTQIHAI